MPISNYLELILRNKVARKFYKACGAPVGWLPDRVKVALKPRLRVLQRMDYTPEEILLDIESDLEFDTRLHSCHKEPETIQWIHSFIKEGDVFYDIGANVGTYSLVASKHLHSHVKVYAFEPGFLNYAQLCKNILANNCQECIIPVQIAFSDHTKIDTLNYNNLTPGGALHALGEPIDYKNDVFTPVFKQSVLAYRLDDFIERFHLPVPNHMKIDVDGNEFKILQGAEETLRNPSLKSLLVELDEGDEEPQQVTEYLRNKGLQLQSKHRYVWGGDNGPYSKGFNYIFQRSDV